MYEDDSQQPDDSYYSSPSPCSQGHRSSLNLTTKHGGNICLSCFTNLITNPNSPTFHVSYALSQLSQSLSHDPPFLDAVLSFHSHILVSPLVQSLSCFDDEQISRQVIAIVVELCDAGRSEEFFGDFVARVSDRCCEGGLVWSRRQVYTLHCLGFLLSNQTYNPYSYIKDKETLVSILVVGLQFPSEEIRGEILFVLFKLSNLQYASKDGSDSDIFYAYSPMLLRLSLEALVKTQSDDVRLNCVAFLTVLAQRGFFNEACASDFRSTISYEADNFMQSREDTVDEPPLSILFAEAIKGPLLSADNQVQISTLNLIFHYLSWEGGQEKQIQALLEENIADYVFEILRLSESKDPVVNSCLLVLNLLSVAELAFTKRLAIGFATLVPVLHYVAEIPFHPVQSQTLKLVWNCVSNCPGILSNSLIEELSTVLKNMLNRHNDGEMGMLPETFNFACSIFVALIKSPSSDGATNFVTSLQEATRDAVLACLSFSGEDLRQLLHSLYLLKEAYAYSHEGGSTDLSKMELKNCILDICKTNLIPCLAAGFNEMEEEIVLGIMETFHSVLLQDSDIEAIQFAKILISSSWFSFSFECLGLFPTEKMKLRVYLMFSSIVDILQGNDSGQIIRDALLHLPSDPMDLLYMLGQKGFHDLVLSSCQSAVLLILYISSLYDERLADDKLVLASLEQYILVSNFEFLSGASDWVIIRQLMNLYGLYRGLAKINYQIPYSPEAEEIIFQLANEKEWDLSSAGIHPRALKWFFQQEKISKPLSYQILKFCRNNRSNGAHMTLHGNTSRIDVQMIAGLIASEDNQGSMLLVYLIEELLEEEGQEHDIVSVVNLIVAIIDIFPSASNHLCLHGISNTIQTSLSYFQNCSPQMVISILLLAFKVLQSVDPETLSDDGAWVTITLKLIEYMISTTAADHWTQESILIIGILSLILHHSTNGALSEASKTILLNKSLVSMLSSTIHSACSKGPLLIEHEEGKVMGETLIYMILLGYFSFRSLNIVLPGVVDWQNFLDPSNQTETFSYITIHCHDLCRLIYFGSPLLKLVSSYSLLEIISRISDQIDKKCVTEDLSSVTAILEGLIFYNDSRVAMNCAICLSMILGWEKLEAQEIREVGNNNWFRLICEELAMSLAVPRLASKLFISSHISAVHVAVALLKMQKVPIWMRSVFDDTCISGLLENLSANNVTTEMVILFEELVNCDYLNDAQIANLNHILQACRRRIYTNNNQDVCTEENFDKVIIVQDDLVKVCKFLILLMHSQSSLVVNSGESKNGNTRLLQEIEMFFRRTEKEGNI